MISGLFKVMNGAKNAVNVMTHPVEWMRDKVKEWIFNIIIKQVCSELQTSHLNRSFNFVENQSLSKNYEFEVPSILQSFICTDDGLIFLNDCITELFEKPLFLLGLKLGRAKLDLISENKIKGVFEFRLHSTKTELTPLT